jgi:hypothetical protein
MRTKTEDKTMRAAATTRTFEEVVDTKKIVMAGAFLMAAALCGLAVSTSHGATIAGWGSDPKTAIQQAKSSSKPLIMVIAAEGCPACEAFAKEAVKPSAVSALSGAVRVRAEASDHPELVQQYAAAGTPTIVVFSPEIGYSTPLCTYTGVLTASELQKLGRTIEPPKTVASSR